MKQGDKVFINEQAQSLLGLTYGIEYYVIDILEETDDIKFPIVLGSDEMGADWRQFFKEDEIIIINN